MKDGDPPRRDKGSVRVPLEPSMKMKRPDNEIARHMLRGVFMLFLWENGRREERVQQPRTVC